MLIHWEKNPNLTQNQILVGSQSESSTRNPKTSSANQNWVSQCRKKPKCSRLGWRTLLGSRLLPNRVGSLESILIHGGSSTPPTWSAQTLTTYAASYDTRPNQTPRQWYSLCKSSMSLFSNDSFNLLVILRSHLLLSEFSQYCSGEYFYKPTESVLTNLQQAVITVCFPFFSDALLLFTQNLLKILFRCKKKTNLDINVIIVVSYSTNQWGFRELSVKTILIRSFVVNQLKNNH